MAVLKDNWHLLTKPEPFVMKDGYDNTTKSMIVMEPLQRGFGTTLGNALRRVLLSSIGGFAITSIRINGVSHEYGSIDGIKEDILDIIMNLKSMAITKSDSSSFTLKISTNKPGCIFAGSIETPAGVDVINKDLLICTLNKGAKIEMHLDVRYGKGYASADNNKNTDHAVGDIAIDAMFNPVKRVAYKIENSRVGQVTDYDRLIMEIVTNGAITPQDALSVAAKILQEQLQSFITFDNKAEVVTEDYIEDDLKLDFNKNLIKTIDELELSVRSYNCLKNENIIYVGDLVSRSETEMLKTANFGRKSLNELKENLKAMGLNFGMKLPDWPPQNLEELLKLKNKEF